LDICFGNQNIKKYNHKLSIDKEVFFLIFFNTQNWDSVFFEILKFFGQIFDEKDCCLLKVLIPKWDYCRLNKSSQEPLKSQYFFWYHLILLSQIVRISPIFIICYVLYIILYKIRLTLKCAAEWKHVFFCSMWCSCFNYISKLLQLVIFYYSLYLCIVHEFFIFPTFLAEFCSLF
jgi:hypothetical protein